MPAAARKIALTDRSLQSLKPTGERSVIWDALLPGHAVRLSARGKRSFSTPTVCILLSPT